MTKYEGPCRAAKLLGEQPDLEFLPKVGHFTFYSLLRTDPLDAVAYGKKGEAASRGDIIGP